MKQNLVWLGFLVFQKLFLKYLFNPSSVHFPQNNRSPSGRHWGDSWAQSPAEGKCPMHLRHPQLSFFWWFSKISSERNSTTHSCILFHYFGRQAVFLIFNLNPFAINYAGWVMAPWKSKFFPAQKLLKYLERGIHYPVNTMQKARDTARSHRKADCKNFVWFSGHSKTKTALHYTGACGYSSHMLATEKSQYLKAKQRMKITTALSY